MTNLEQVIKEFDDCFPEGKRRPYNSYPYPLEEVEREALKEFIQEKLTAQREEIIGIFQGVKPLMERHEQELWDEAINLIKKDEV